MRRPPERGKPTAKKAPQQKQPAAKATKPATVTNIRAAAKRKNRVSEKSERWGRVTAKRPPKIRTRRSNPTRTAVQFASAPKGRKVVSLTLLSSLGVLLLLVIATLTTPLLAVQQLRITGLNSVSEKQVRAAIKDQIGTPLALINQQHVVDELSGFTRIESVSIIAELPHTLHVAITERAPIAIVVVGGVAYLFDPAGIKLDAAKSSDLYPIISSATDPSTSQTYKESISVLLALPSELLPKIASVNASSRDNVTLQLRGYAGQSIIWGDSSQAILKSRVLAALIANQKPTDRVTYDVSSPSAPVVRWR